MHRHPWSSRRRLVTLLVLILVVSFAAVSAFNYAAARRSVREEIANSLLPLTRENIYSEVLRDLMPPVNMASVMANDSFLVEWALDGEQDVEAVTRYLERIRASHDFFSAFFVSQRTGKYYYHGGVLKTISRTDEHDVWYYRFIESGEPYVLDVDTNQAADDRLTIFINYRLEDGNGRLLGVTGVGMEMLGFSQFLARKQRQYDRRIYMTDASGIIQTHSDMSVIRTQRLHDRAGIRDVADRLLEPRQEPVNAEYAGSNGSVLVTSRYMPEIDWFLIVEQDVRKALRTARVNLFRTVAFGIVTSLLIVVIIVGVVRRYQSRIERMASTDELTGASNRRRLEERFEQAQYRFTRYGRVFSVIMVDVDRFKLINDTMGHLVGDRVLQTIARVASNTVRPTDLVARWGGDEFVILAECSAADAAGTAERLRAAVARVPGGTVLPADAEITVSCGVTQYEPSDSLDTLTGRADEALYRAKEAGRDRVSCLAAAEQNVRCGRQ